MNWIDRISEEKYIFNKGDVTFEVVATAENSRAYVTNEDGSERLYIEKNEFEDVWVPKLKSNFPKLSTDMYSWVQDTPFLTPTMLYYRKGYVIIYESSEITNLNRFLNVLSDIPDEFDESPLSVRDMSAKDLMVALERFRMEIPSNSILMMKFDELFPQ